MAWQVMKKSIAFEGLGVDSPIPQESALDQAQQEIEEWLNKIEQQGLQISTVSVLPTTYRSDGTLFDALVFAIGRRETIR